MKRHRFFAAEVQLQQRRDEEDASRALDTALQRRFPARVLALGSQGGARQGVC